MSPIRRAGALLGRINTQLRLFLLATLCVGIAGGVFETTFNNYLDHTFDIGADTRGFLEFPRELPGFLTALFAGALFFLPETMIAAVSSLAIGLGMMGLALWGGTWAPMMVFMILWSIGTHLLMPVNSSISMHLADPLRRGRRLGEIYAVGISSSLLGCGVVWLASRHLQVNYAGLHAFGALAGIAGAVCFAMMRLPGAHLRRPKFIWRRAYWLYYVLALLFGARKQIFITFGPWVLVRVFDQPVYIIAQLWIVAALIGVAFQPVLGRAIDRFGERRVLMADSLCVFAVCMGYGYSNLVHDPTAAVWLLYACYIGDNLLFGANMARTTYLSKIALAPEHVAPTLSLGITINHAVSMSVPALGGLLWVSCGHTAVFLAAAGIAVIMFAFTSLIRLPAPSA